MNHCCRTSICSGNNGGSICPNRNSVLGTNSLQDSRDTEECNCTEQSFHQTLCECIGLKCCCEFEIEGDLVSKTGILERVGSDYLLLRSMNNNNALLCNLCDLKFVTVTC